MKVWNDLNVSQEIKVIVTHRKIISNEDVKLVITLLIFQVDLSHLKSSTV